MALPHAPDQFFTFSEHILPVWRELGSGPEASIDLAIKLATSDETAVVRTFLLELVNGAFTDQELHDFWWRSGSGIGPNVAGTRNWMREIVQRIDGKRGPLGPA